MVLERLVDSPSVLAVVADSGVVGREGCLCTFGSWKGWAALRTSRDRQKVLLGYGKIEFNGTRSPRGAVPPVGYVLQFRPLVVTGGHCFPHPEWI